MGIGTKTLGNTDLYLKPFYQNNNGALKKKKWIIHKTKILLNLSLGSLSKFHLVLWLSDPRVTDQSHWIGLQEMKVCEIYWSTVWNQLLQRMVFVLFNEDKLRIFN